LMADGSAGSRRKRRSRLTCSTDTAGHTAAAVDMRRGLFQRTNICRPLPARPAGEEDFRLDARRKRRQDPCHLVWQVNEILRRSRKIPE
jgi:hypothetical protein